MRRLGTSIRTRREALGLKQEEAAAAAGLSLATWNKLENGRGGAPMIDTKRGVCRALAWTADSIDRVLAGSEVQPAGAPSEPTAYATSSRLEERLGRMTPEQRAAARAAIETMLDRFEAELGI